MASYSFVHAQVIPGGPYLGQTPPGLEPQVFAPGVVTLANRDEWTGVFTPDGQEFYFSVSNPGWSGYRLMMARQQEGAWTAPVVLPFSGQYIDLWPHLSPDGHQLFFTSSRPEQTWLDTNVWMCERQGSGWSDPVKLGLNHVGRDYAGTCTADGTHYFGSRRNGGMSIFRSTPVDGEYTYVEMLPYPINIASGYNQHPYVAPDESYLIFCSDRGATWDLYISYRNADDSWQEPINLGPSINSPDSEWLPSLSPDGQYLFFSRSTGSTSDPQNLDLYWVRTAAFMPDPNGPIHNLNSEQRFSSLQLAINYAHPGNTLVLEPGVYQESITIDKDLVVQSADPNDPVRAGGTILQANGDEPALTLRKNTRACEIAGLTLRAGSVGIMGTATNATVRNCRIMDNLTDGMDLSQGSSPHLIHCLITANGQTGIRMHSTGGRFPSYCEPLIENCHIVNNNEAGIIGGKPVIVNSVLQEP
jgi:hypothetical protein